MNPVSRLGKEDNVEFQGLGFLGCTVIFCLAYGNLDLESSVEELNEKLGSSVSQRFVGAMAVSMLQLSRSGAYEEVGSRGNNSKDVRSWGLWNVRKSAVKSCHSLHLSDSRSDASILSFSDSRNRCGRLKRGRTDETLLRFVATAVLETEKAVTLLHDIYVGAVSGATAGVVVEAALYPIDTIKTRLQAAHLGGSQSLFKGLYSGLVGNLAGVLPASAVFVGVYEPVKRKLLSVLPDQLNSVAHLTAGICGGAISSLIRVPTEVVKQRMQTGQFVSAQAAVRQIVAKEGIRGLYAGYGSFLLRDLPFDAFQFCIYEQLKIGYSKRVGRELNDPEAAFIGAIAGAITGALTTPLDVIKTRLMIQGTNGQYKGIHDCVMKIVREEGAGTLLQGLGPRILWIGLGGSIFLVLWKRRNVLWRKGPCRRSLQLQLGVYEKRTMLSCDNSSDDILTFYLVDLS